MSLAKNIYRKIVAPTIVKFGLETFYKSKKNNLILCYHGVSKEFNTLNNRNIRYDQFEKQLIYINKHFNVLPLYEMFETKLSKNSKKNIAITFDDGYRNNFDVALPIIEKHKIPVTFFIATEGLFEENYLMWPDIFDSLKFDKQNKIFEFNNQVFIRKENTIVHSITHENISVYTKKLGKERDVELKKFKEKYNCNTLIQNVPDEMYKFLNKTELIKLSQSNFVTIGSHTHKHYNLSNINVELSFEELIQSKKNLEDIIQKPVLSIAYPDGSYNNNVKSLAENAGYKYQLAVPYKEESDINDKRILPRYSISNTTTYESNIIQINKQFDKSGF